MYVCKHISYLFQKIKYKLKEQTNFVIQINGQRLNIFHFPDEIAIIAEYEKDLQYQKKQKIFKTYICDVI